VSAGKRLTRVLEASAQRAGCAVRIAAASERAWASATFTGTHHLLIIKAAPSSALAAWLGSLPHTQFALPGHVVADLTVRGVPDGAEVSALTLEA
jgi:hypothetical protein